MNNLDVNAQLNAKVDYLKLIKQYGCQVIDKELIERFTKVTGRKVHPWIKRGIFFAHKHLDKILDDHEAGRPIYLYTRKGPSSDDSMHLGQLVPFLFIKWLQSVFNCHVVIQMSDDEKFMFEGTKSGKTLHDYYHIGHRNTHDILACGFDPDKTYVFSNFMNMNNRYYYNIVKLMAINNGTRMNEIYGMTLDNSIGQMTWPCIQCAGVFSTSFGHISPYFDRAKPVSQQLVRCLVPMTIDQIPNLTLADDFVNRYENEGHLQPATINFKFLPGLDEIHTSNSVIMLNDTSSEVATKIKRYAFSDSNPDTDVSFQYLTYFMTNEKRLQEIETDYRSGKLSSEELKNIAIVTINEVLEKHQKAKQEFIDLPEKTKPFYLPVIR